MEGLEDAGNTWRLFYPTALQMHLAHGRNPEKDAVDHRRLISKENRGGFCGIMLLEVARKVMSGPSMRGSSACHCMTRCPFSDRGAAAVRAGIVEVKLVQQYNAIQLRKLGSINTT